MKFIIPFIFMLAIFLPLLGSVVNMGLSARHFKTGKPSLAWPAFWGVSSVAISFFLFCALLVLLPEFNKSTPFITEVFRWINLPSYHIDIAYRYDALSAFMAMVVTGIGGLIHVYSTGYMNDNRENYAKYFAYLNLFIFSMLNLVLADNMMVLFLGWEGVGLCSFLLIGFDSHKKSANTASRMAFIVNRIGDAGFIIGIFLLMMYTGTLQFDKLNKALATQILQPSTLDTIAFFLLLGALAKSAQIPLYLWLPSAMAGPTPVSALIHAATMVTAGIFMIARLSLLFSGAIHVSVAIAYIGAATALLGALIALTQTDIKKILAYSTVSQLGFMFMAMGTGSYHAGMFHLLTHAFFKALLFLGAGAVILVMHHEQDVRKMGGLIEKHKFLAVVFWCGGLALAGFPGFSGFFSKDMILESAYKFRFGGEILFLVGVFTALLTAFYTLRMILLVFYGKPRFHPHEGESLKVNIRFPLIVLACLSVIGGFIGLPALFTGTSSFIEKFFLNALQANTAQVFEPYRYPVTHGEEFVLLLISVAVVFAGLVLSYFRYKNPHNVPIPDGAYRKPPVQFSYQAFHIEYVVQGILVKPLKNLGQAFARWENAILDKTLEGFKDLIDSLSRKMSGIQTGQISDYALYTAIGILTIISFLLWGIH